MQGPLFFVFTQLDFMTEPISALPMSDETADVLRFLRRFADMMSTGSNYDNLVRAAGILELHGDLLKETRELLQVERIRGDASAETRKSLEAKIAELEAGKGELEARIGGLENEVLTLKSKLLEQQSNARETLAAMEKQQGEFLRRAEAAEAELAAHKAAPPVIQAEPSAIPFGSIAVPLSTLQLAKAQFQSLALVFEKSGNIVSQVMSEASASNLDRLMLDAGVADDDDEDRSQDAA